MPKLISLCYGVVKVESRSLKVNGCIDQEIRKPKINNN